MFDYVWTESYDEQISKNNLNICGDPVGEGKFAVPFEAVFAHEDTSIIVQLGALLDRDPCDASWGISSFRLYVR